MSWNKQDKLEFLASELIYTYNQEPSSHKMFHFLRSVEDVKKDLNKIIEMIQETYADEQFVLENSFTNKMILAVAESQKEQKEKDAERKAKNESIKLFLSDLRKARKVIRAIKPKASIYVFTYKSGLVKLGFSTKVSARLKQHANSSYCPLGTAPDRLLGLFEVYSMEDETNALNRLSTYKATNARSCETFNAPFQEVLSVASEVSKSDLWLNEKVLGMAA
jgi:predicted GIY-YIG superfamily endonuclease